MRNLKTILLMLACFCSSNVTEARSSSTSAKNGERESEYFKKIARAYADNPQAEAKAAEGLSGPAKEAAVREHRSKIIDDAQKTFDDEYVQMQMRLRKEFAKAACAACDLLEQDPVDGLPGKLSDKARGPIERKLQVLKEKRKVRAAAALAAARTPAKVSTQGGRGALTPRNAKDIGKVETGGAEKVSFRGGKAGDTTLGAKAETGAAEAVSFGGKAPGSNNKPPADLGSAESVDFE